MTLVIGKFLPTFCIGKGSFNVFSKSFTRSLSVSYQNAQKENTLDDKDTINCSLVEKSASVLTDIAQPIFSELVHEVKNKVGFWKSERGLEIKDKVLTGSGRVLRMFVSIERYDNWWEDTLNIQKNMRNRTNQFDEILCQNHGAEWALCYIVLHMGGAFKLVTDDRWIDHHGNLRTPTKKDCTVEAVDMRKSAISYHGMKYFDNVGYIRYLNVADSKMFDNNCMTRLHNLTHVLEYLDISGTAVTPEGFTYLRIFPKLKWLNISRLSNSKQLEALVPYLQEILPQDCVIITNDNLPSESYGSEIPYRCPTDSTQDLLLDKDPGIGDLQLFNDEYDFSALQVSDVTLIHQLWKTPLVTKERLRRAKLLEPSKNTPTMTLVKYLVKAEQYKPLL